MIFQYIAWLSLRRIQPDLTDAIWATSTNGRIFPQTASSTSTLLIPLHICRMSQAVFLDFVKECGVITYNEYPLMNSGVTVPKPKFLSTPQYKVELRLLLQIANPMESESRSCAPLFERL